MRDPGSPPVIRMSSARSPLGARTYGLRLLYVASARRRLALVLAAVAVLDYLREAISDLAAIDHRPLQFDFGQFFRAAQDLSAGRNPYDVFLNMHCPGWCLGGYIYTPLLAEFLRPLSHLSLARAASAWLLLTHVMVAATAIILWRALRGWTTVTALATMLAAALLFQPLFENLSYVQIGTLLLLMLAGSASLHLGQGLARQGWSGALVGLATVVKITPLLMAPALLPVGWAAGKPGGYRLRQGLVAIGGMLLATTILVAGMLLLVPHTADFFTRVLPHIGGGTTSYENKSFAAFVGRLDEWVGFLQPAWHLGIDTRLVGLAGVALFVAPVAWLAARRVPRAGTERPVRAAAFAAYLAAMPIVSTITWRHHLVVSILAMALLLPALWPRVGPPASSAARWLLLASYGLMYVPQETAHFLALGPRGAVTPTLSNAIRVLFIEDLNLLGMTCLWLACVLALRGLLGAAREDFPSPG
ncbi:MAG: hypothetical protein NVS3B24_03080 [Candidatus Dormibacteria bacterium]